MKYEIQATKATQAGLLPATAEQTLERWQALGVTRQTKWNWQTDPSRVPLMARLAAAWLIHEGRE
jgi:protein involved in temperature-dependent protein secretion